MGKGDKKTKRGKIILGSFGVRRPHRSKTLTPVVTLTKKVEKAKTEKPKAVKHPETIVEPIDVAIEALDQPVVAEKKTVKPKAPKKTSASTVKTKDTTVE